VLDAGAGGFYFAEDVVQLNQSPKTSLSGEKQKWLQQLVKKPASQRPSVTGVSLNLERETLPTNEKLKLLWGRFFLEIEDSELGQFDLITDLNGIFAYGPNADEILRKYNRLLRRKGEVFLYIGEDQENGFAFRSKVKMPDGKVITLANWIQTIPGLRVTRLSSETDGKNHLTLRISIRNPKKVKIPKLALMGIDTTSKGAPTRMYYQKKLMRKSTNQPKS
jgi:SAM-dependent methyltransferase